MKTSSSLYQTRPLTGPALTFAEMIREWSDSELEAFGDVQFSDWDHYATSGDTYSADYRRAQLEDVAAEKSRRVECCERHDGDPLTPQWNNTKAKDYERLKALATYLKERWPVDRFMSELMAVDLHPAPKSHIGRCPFPDHVDETPSFHAYSSDDHWHCFGCNRTGDVFDLVGMYFNLESFRACVEKLASATPGISDHLMSKNTHRHARRRKGVRLQGGKLVAA